MFPESYFAILNEQTIVINAINVSVLQTHISITFQICIFSIVDC